MRIYFLLLANLVFINSVFSLKHSFLKIDSIVTPHPRILLFKNDESQFIKEIKSDKNKRVIHQAIINYSDSILKTDPVKRVLIGIRLLDKSREFLKRIFYLSYAFRTTGKIVYADRAKVEMLTVASFTDWNEKHFLDVGEMTTGMAIGYDWLYDQLSKKEKELIEGAIINKALIPSLNNAYNKWLYLETNWNQVCNAGMLLGAIAVYEKNPALSRSIIDRSIKSIKLPMKQYAPDGGYPEGYGYWEYGTNFNVLFISVLEKLFSTDYNLLQSPGFLNTGKYYLNMLGPFGFCFNYSDCFTSYPDKNISPAMFWFANKNKDRNLLHYQIQNSKNYHLSFSEEERLLPAALIWSFNMSLTNIPKPSQKMWYGTGINQVSLMRSNWNSKNAFFVGLKGGSASVSHSHLDIGSFVFDALGERWSMDFPMQQYNELESTGINLWDLSQTSERWSLFRYNNFAHSTLTFNKHYQNVKGNAPLLGYSDSDEFRSTVVDLTSIYKEDIDSVQRGVAIVEEKYVLVRDEIKSGEKSALIRWTMVTPAKVNMIDAHNIELSQNRKKLLLKIVQPVNIKIKTWPSIPSRAQEASNEGINLVGFEYEMPAKSSVALNVLLIPQSGKKINIKKVLPLHTWYAN